MSTPGFFSPTSCMALPNPVHDPDDMSSHSSAGTVQHCQHPRNEMTISKIPEIIVTTPEGHSYSPFESDFDSVILGTGIGTATLGSNPGTLFAVRQTVHKGKQIASPSASDSVELQLFQDYSSISDMPLAQSWRRPGLERRDSESSDDSRSTIGPDSWSQ
jgi:hypothetical protein